MPERDTEDENVEAKKEGRFIHECMCTSGSLVTLQDVSSSRQS